jgi:NADH-quinone oxidoreductase subunit J
MNETLHRRDRRWQRWALSLGTLLAGVLATAAAWAAQDKVFTAPGADVATPGNLWAFYIIGGLTVAGAVATITRRNPVVAAVCLVGTLACSAGIYVLLHATFMAAMQVLIYAGAIMVLFIFVVMTVERPDEETVGLGHALGTKVIGVVALGLLFFRLIPVVMGPEVRLATVIPSRSDFGTVTNIGNLLFKSNYLFPFEALSILLLVAIVGAVVVSRRKRASDDPQTEEGKS